MAIGDFLLGGEQLFTPEMASAGIRLIIGGTTDEIRRTTAKEQQISPGLRGDPLAPVIPGSQQVGGGGRSFALFPEQISREPQKLELAPFGTRPSPFGPDVPLRANEFAEQIEKKGGFFSNLGKALTSQLGAGEGEHVNVGIGKFLISLGETVSGPDALSRLGFSLADAEAERQFSELLDIVGPNVPESQIKIPGLTAESRTKILEGRRTAGLEERQEARLERGVDITEDREGRLQSLHGLVLRDLRQKVKSGELELEEAQKRAEFSNQLRKLGPKSSKDLLTAGSKILGIELPKGVNLDNIPFDDAFELLMEAGSQKRARISKQVTAKAEDKLTAPQKVQRIAALKTQKARILAKATTKKPLTASDEKLLGKIDDRLLKLGATDLSVPTPVETGLGADATDEERVAALRAKLGL